MPTRLEKEPESSPRSPAGAGRLGAEYCNPTARSGSATFHEQVAAGDTPGALARVKPAFPSASSAGPAQGATRPRPGRRTHTKRRRLPPVAPPPGRSWRHRETVHRARLESLAWPQNDAGKGRLIRRIGIVLGFETQRRMLHMAP